MEKIKILFLAADPADSNRLHLDREYKRIKQAIAQSGFRDKLELHSEWAVNANDLLRALYTIRPQILHFTGHGQKKGIYVLGNDGLPQLLFAEGFAELTAFFSGCIECVVLSACSSGEMAKDVNTHIPYVMATSDDVNEVAAIDFAEAFYMALATQPARNYTEAFKMGKLQAGLTTGKAADIIIWLENKELAMKLNERIAATAATEMPPAKQNEATITGDGIIVIKDVAHSHININQGGNNKT